MPYKGRRGGPGSAGGRALVAKYGRAHMARIGLLGAQALLDQHGCEHMAEIGRNGYYKVMARHGVTRPQPPIPWNVRRFQAPPMPSTAQTPLLLFDDLDHAA